PEKISEAVRKIRAGGGTALYDAVYLAITDKRYGLSREEGRRLVILITDGDDNSSRKSLSETLEAAQRNEVAIYAISTNKTADFQSKDSEKGDKTLRKMADDTGGRVFFPLKFESLAQSFLDLGQELRAQYTLAYAPTNTKLDGTFRRVRVEV